MNRLLSRIKKITYRTYHAAQNYPQLSDAFILKNAHQTVLNIKKHPASVEEVDSPVLTINQEGGITHSEASAHFKGNIMCMDQLIRPSILYSIPQFLWQNFIAELPNQKVVKTLNLEKHRHLWPAYNFSHFANTESLQLKRAGLIGNYHFLLSFSHPYKFEHFSISRFEVYQEIYQLLEEGIYIPEKIKAINPHFTRHFLKKMAHCTDDYELQFFADHVDLFSKISGKESSEKRATDAIHWLPSSTNEPRKFGQSLQFLDQLQSILPYSRAQRALLFFNSREQWDHPIKIQLEYWEEYAKAVFVDLIWSNPRALQTFNGYIDAKEEFIKKLLAVTNLNQLEKLTQRWNTNRHLIETAKPHPYKNWLAIIEDQTFNQIKISVLTSKLALQNHGETMQHCVAGYAKDCLENITDILTLTDPQGGQSTLQVTYNRRNKKFYILQHRAKENAQPSEQHSNIAQKLVYWMNSKLIPVNIERLNEPPKSHRFPYNVITQESIYQKYIELKILPLNLRAKSYEEMIEEIAIFDPREGHAARP